MVGLEARSSLWREETRAIDRDLDGESAFTPLRRVQVAVFV